ncbi:MAG: formylglycine-generating enzyme family protein [Kiritimatiellae bacterium]|nr:formylglycine-generating enzyme family protein [Kiritimatiellia bacterium]
MKTAKAVKVVTGLMIVVLAWGAMAGAPAVSDVVVRQRWPWSRLVDIDYVLTCDPTASVDVRVTAKDGTVPLHLPLASLSGHMYDVTPGPRRIIFDPTVTVYTNSQMLTQFSVTLTPAAPPLYMIVDLTKDAGAEGQIAYVYEEDLTNGVWGAWVRNPVTNNGEVIESVIWTGAATDDLYKTDKLALRRVPAGSFQLGDTQNGTDNVTLTKGMYAGVFEVTQKQWNLVMGTTGGTDTQAKQAVSYYDIREDPANADDPAVDWPSNRTVNADSFMGRLRAKTGIADFDLPTGAQWEYLCRAGTTTVFNDGNGDADYSLEGVDNNNGNTNGYLNALGWYKYNDPTPPAAAQPAGGKLPNAWGLYDTHGNVWEWCLDWYGVPGCGDDPVGAYSGSTRLKRGGGWSYIAADCISAKRAYEAISSHGNYMGFRLVRTLP